MTLPSMRHFGNRTAGRECTHEGGAISNCRTDNFPETGQFINELFALERTSIDAIRYQDKGGMALPAAANLIDDFKRSDRGLQVKSRGCARHDDQVGDRNRGAESPLAGRR